MLRLEQDGDLYVVEYYGDDAGVVSALLGIEHSDDPRIQTAYPSTSLHDAMDGVRVELGRAMTVSRAAAEAIAELVGLELITTVIL